MPRVPTPENIWEMKYLLNRGDSIRVVAEELGVTPQCVRKWRSRFAAEANGGPIAADLRKSRRTAYKISDEDLNRVQDFMRQNPFHSVRRLPAILNIPVNEKTLRRSIKKRTNLRFRRPAKKAQLTPLDTVARLQYANAHINRPMSMWRRTICLDEKVFSTSSDGKVH